MPKTDYTIVYNDFVHKVFKKNLHKTRTDLEHALLEFLPSYSGHMYSKRRLLKDDKLIAEIVCNSSKYGEMTPLKVIFNRDLTLEMKKDIINTIKKYKLGIRYDG